MPETQAQDPVDPLHVFRFHVDFYADNATSSTAVCSGAFSEISGLEATMQPVAISQGGHNWGQAQLPGRTTFSTVILKRGITVTRHLWTWFHHTNGLRGSYAHRMRVTIRLQDASGNDKIRWTLKRALPVKLKLADLNSTSADLGVEELHLVHEGIEEALVSTTSGAGSSS